jgi:hypothetical protein
MGRQFQFSFRSLLLATAWMSVFFASLSLGLGINNYARSWPDNTKALAALVLMLLICVSPSFAVGHLTERPIVAISCGVAIVFVTVAILSFILSLQK